MKFNSEEEYYLMRLTHIMKATKESKDAKAINKSDMFKEIDNILSEWNKEKGALSLKEITLKIKIKELGLYFDNETGRVYDKSRILTVACVDEKGFYINGGFNTLSVNDMHKLLDVLQEYAEDNKEEEKQ